MGVDGGHEADAVPDPGRDQVAPHHQGAERHREQVRERVLQGVRVERGQAQGRAPLVMDLVDARVQGGAVEDNVRVVEANLLNKHKHDELGTDLQR